jgi:uncharacterized protein (TIGR02001 family)
VGHAHGRHLCPAVLRAALPALRLSAAVAALLCAAAHADWGGSLALLSDYRYRGISFSDLAPAAQARIDWNHARGIFAGALATTIRSADDRNGGSVQAVAGYGRAGDGWNWSAGVAGYSFPSWFRPAGDYAELFARIGRGEAQAGLFVSDNYFDSGARSAYLDVSAAHAVNDSLSLALHLGWLVTGEAKASYWRYQDVNQLDGRFGMLLDLRDVTVELSIAGLLTETSRCAARSRCAPGPVFVLRKDF